MITSKKVFYIVEKDAKLGNCDNYFIFLFLKKMQNWLIMSINIFFDLKTDAELDTYKQLQHKTT